MNCKWNLILKRKKIRNLFIKCIYIYLADQYNIMNVLSFVYFILLKCHLITRMIFLTFLYWSQLSRSVYHEEKKKKPCPYIHSFLLYMLDGLELSHNKILSIKPYNNYLLHLTYLCLLQHICCNSCTMVDPPIT